MFHYVAGVIFQDETEIIHVGEGALPGEQLQRVTREAMSDERDIVIVQVGRPRDK